MTRQNVPLDPKSRISVTFEMTIPKSSMLTMAAQKPPPAPSGCITISRNKRVSNIDINGEARINSWLDSMKASSPTHIKATPLADRDPSSFIVRHPSALDKFEQIIEASMGKKIVMFLDYDGTLSPIVDDPDQAFMSEDMNSSFTFGNTVAVAPGSSVAAPPAPGGYPYPLEPGNGGYPYPLAPSYGGYPLPPGNGGYPYPLAPGYGGYPIPQMQPQKKTSMVKKFAKKLGAFLCGLVRIAAIDAIFDNI